MKPNVSSRYPNGLTLLELLVVIAIMFLLAAFLGPTFVQVRSKARQSTCVCNLQQIVRAGMMYVQDNDGRFPSCYQTDTPPNVVDPRTSLQPYIKNWGIFYCPERFTVRNECLDPFHNFQPPARCMGYGYNWGSGLGWGSSYLKGDGLVRQGPSDEYGYSEVIGVNLEEVATPSHTFFYGDTNDFLYITLLRDAMPGVLRETLWLNGPQTDDLGQPYEPPRHTGGNNFAFVDGHVAWLRFPGGTWIDGGPWVVPDMSMYSRTGRWETKPLP